FLGRKYLAGGAFIHCLAILHQGDVLYFRYNFFKMMRCDNDGRSLAGNVANELKKRFTAPPHPTPWSVHPVPIKSGAVTIILPWNTFNLSSILFHKFVLCINIPEDPKDRIGRENNGKKKLYILKMFVT